MQAFGTNGLDAERQIVVNRLASAPALNELMVVLADAGSSGTSGTSAEVLRRLSPGTGMEVLAALRGGSPRPQLFADRRPGQLVARPRLR